MEIKTLRERVTQATTPQELRAVVEAEYALRQGRRVNPAGTFDKAGRFDLDDSERCECCRSIRVPSRHWPYSEMTHARTRKHVTQLVAKLARELDAERVSHIVAHSATSAEAADRTAAR